MPKYKKSNENVVDTGTTIETLIKSLNEASNSKTGATIFCHIGHHIPLK